MQWQRHKELPAGRKPFLVEKVDFFGGKSIMKVDATILWIMKQKKLHTG